MDYRNFIASTILNGGMIKNSRYGLVPIHSRSITSGIKHMKLGTGTPAHKKINELEFLDTKKKPKKGGGSGYGSKTKGNYKPLTLKF
jgi:hypothetical protein